MSKHIPKSVPQWQVNEALKPLCDLLGITILKFYADPGLIVGDGKITFVIPAVRPSEWAEERPQGPVDNWHPQEGREISEHMTGVTVDVDRDASRPKGEQERAIDSLQESNARIAESLDRLERAVKRGAANGRRIASKKKGRG